MSNSAEKYIIKNVKSGLVLDATEFYVKIQNYSSSTLQHWTLQDLDGGKFRIINVGNGKAMDIKDGAHIANIITWPIKNPPSTNQEWFINADGTVECPVQNLVLDIEEEDLIPGNYVIAYPKTGKQNQIFSLETVKK
ncbi:uncharacterized protein LOC123005561 [Tribolium madens]|uniref:uncharacterized protein LOC123005561 n=1 Tax=Tribolium madens TaxID=41895 RepID=UPI001CF733C9|nr:uncharacterized protein LOC123005561 [Tribolium madens]